MAAGEKPITRPEINAATRMLEPVADSQLRLKMAASAVGFATLKGKSDMIPENSFGQQALKM
jgi:hypothetical protein